MKEKIKSNNKIYTGIFLFLLLIFFLSPISGDDWGNYLEGAQGIYHMFSQAVGMWFTWEGRLISRVLINILTYNKWLWNIVNAATIVGMIYYVNKIVNFKHKKLMILLTFITILFMNIFTFSQTVTWLAGNITYLFVIPLLLIYIYIIYNGKYNKFTNILLVILNIIIPMFIEHMAILLILLNVYFIVKDYIKNKTINKKLILFLIISIISFLSMYLSPGNRIRSSMENLEFNKLSLFGKIMYNIPNLIFYTYRINYFLIILLVIGNFILIKKHIKNKLIRIILYLIELISLVFTCVYLLNSFNINTISISDNNIFVIIYFIVLTIINLLLLIKNKKELTVLFYSMALISNGVMLMSPTWGYRTSLATYLFMAIAYLIVIDEYYKKNKIIEYSTVVITILGMLFYLVFYISIYRTSLANEKMIKEANKNNISRIELIAYPGFAPCNINPVDPYHLKRFKEYYNINEDTEIEIVNRNWKYIIFYYE
jgi:hypothetical protein